MPFTDPKLQAFLEKSLGKPAPGHEGGWSVRAGLGMLPTPGILTDDVTEGAVSKLWSKGLKMFQNGEAIKVIQKGNQLLPVAEGETPTGFVTLDGQLITKTGITDLGAKPASSPVEKLAQREVPAVSSSGGRAAMSQETAKKAPRMVAERAKIPEAPPLSPAPLSEAMDNPVLPETNAADLVEKLKTLITSGSSTPSKIDTIIQDLANLSTKHNAAQGTPPNLLQNMRSGHVKMFQDFVKTLQKK